MRLTGAVLVLIFSASCAREPESVADTVFGRGGQTQWVEVAEGRLKTEIYTSPQLSAHPILMVVLHGDLPNPRPSYQYALAQLVTQGVAAVAMPDAVRARLGKSAVVDDVVAVGVLRPGYTDGKGDRSDGDMGMAALDNFTPEVTDAIATVVRK
jgi:poly(3-hydroxybutyrate) depolymerase